MKVYELKMQKGGKAVYKVSLVKGPAVNDTLLYFKKEGEQIVTFADEEKREIYSLVMRPNILIPRNNINGEQAQTFYTSGTVRDCQINYFRNNGNLFTNINHSENSNASGIFPFESWIVKDSKNDKSTSMGMDSIDGDWIMGYKIDNDELWNDYIKTGKLDGLSIEATNFNYEFKKEINMSKQTTDEKTDLQKILDFILMRTEVSAKHAEEETPEEEEKPEEEMAEEEVKPEEEEEVKEADETPADETPTEREQLLMDEIVSLKGTIAQLEADKVKEETELETMKAQILAMKKETPAATKIKNVPTKQVVKTYEEMNNAEKTKFNREN
jgi:hypothetical protein